MVYDLTEEEVKKLATASIEEQPVEKRLDPVSYTHLFGYGHCRDMEDSYSAWKQAEIDIHIIRSLNVLE